MRRLAFVTFICLTGCGPWPDIRGPETNGAAKGWPTLLPLDQVLATGLVTEADDRDATALSRRAAALRARAAILRSDSSDLDALRARLAR